MERAAVTSGVDLARGGPCRGARVVGHDGREGVEAAVEPPDALEEGLGEIDRRDLPASDERPELGARQVEDVFAEAHRMRRGAMGRNTNAGSLPGSSGKSRSVLSCLASAAFCSAMPLSIAAPRARGGGGGGTG